MGGGRRLGDFGLVFEIFASFKLGEEGGSDQGEKGEKRGVHNLGLDPPPP